MERFPRLIHRSPVIIEHSLPVILILIHRCFALRMTVIMAVREREVGRIVRHGVPFVLYSNAYIGKREVSIYHLGDGNILY